MNHREGGTEGVDAEETEEPLQGAIYPELPPVRWEFEKQFNSQEDFDKFMAEENCWSCRSKEILKDGIKILYRCNKVKYKGKKYSAQLYILHQILLLDDEMGNQDEQYTQYI